jgi:DNA-binding NarL/FixJ family response regulator
MNRRRVLLADDHATTMKLWRTLLEPEFDIVGTVDDGEALVRAAGRLAPDVIVADIALPGMSGIADSAMVRSGLAAGAYGFVLKFRAGDDLVPAIRAALRGELLISPFPRIDDAVNRD